MHNIKIQYDGEYPNLCSGNLIVTINGKEWHFVPHALHSGGCVSFDDNWSETVTAGAWDIWDDDWPANFPNELKDEVLKAINNEIPWGCCGGCV